MTGLSTLLFELDDPAGSGTFPYDITPWVDLRAQWSVTGGRADELGEVDPRTARLTLNNNDGRFTLGSPVYGGLVVDQRLRITETFGSTVSKRITGYVQDWPTTFADPAARGVPCTITVTDRQARLNRRPLPAPVLYEALDADPYVYYPMTDEAGATTSADYSGANRPTLKVAGSGAPFAAGISGAAGTGYLFQGGTYLRSDHPSFACAAIGVWFTATGPPPVDATLLQVSSTVSETASSLKVMLLADGTIGTLNTEGQVGEFSVVRGITDTRDVYFDGLPHFVVFYLSPDTRTTRTYVDGELFDEYVDGGPAMSTPDKDRIVVGFRSKGITISNVSLYPVVPTATQVRDQYRSVLGISEDSHERFARIARYAGVPAGDLDLEPGVLTSTAPQALEKDKAASALSAVSMAEGGTWFVDGDGKVVLQNRTHRVHTASQPPAVELTSADVEHDDLVISVDKQYLQNLASGSRPDGATQESQDAASIAAYDVYPGPDLSGLLVTTDPEVKDRLDWQVNAYSQPKPRINRVSIDLLTLEDPAKVEALLALELGDRITIDGLPAQSPIETADLLVEGFEETQQQAVNSTVWRLTLNTVSADLFRVWILEDPVYGVLDSTTRLHY